MLACRELQVRPRAGAPALVVGATAEFGAGKLHALIGPSGCGKTTLLKGLLGILPAEGEVRWRGQRVAPGAPDLLREVAFAPQFSIAPGKLTVREALDDALALVRALPPAERASRGQALLAQTGLTTHAENLVEKLSGGQTRRLGLALELASDPACLLCDEVTSGLDPRAEDQILALLRALVATQGRTVVCVIHNLAKLEQFDVITVIHAGAVVFQGDHDALCAHFGIGDALLLYDRLADTPAPAPRPPAPMASHASEPDASAAPDLHPRTGDVPLSPAAPGSARQRPTCVAQFAVLLRRRWRIFRRDRGTLALTAAITFGFPCLVVIFALGGLPQLRGLALEQPAAVAGLLEAMQARAEFRREAADTAMLVSGLILFQVILLCLMGSNNGAREIAGERALYEKERMAGLRPGAYAAAKLVWVSALGAGQGAWMAVFVKSLCAFPGSWGAQVAVLAATGAALSAVCLGLSAMLATPERASLLSIYVVGFQLPLSGVVLALPAALVWGVRPFIATYWGWAGYLTAMRDSRSYDAVVLLDPGWLAPPAGALAVLGAHFAAGAALAVWGCKVRRWP